jgi:hypothetical protein
MSVPVVAIPGWAMGGAIALAETEQGCLGHHPNDVPE